MFLSSVFYPLERVPAWVRSIALINPLTWHTDILRYLTLGIGQLQHILLEAAGFVGFSLLAFWLAIRTLQKTI